MLATCKFPDLTGTEACGYGNTCRGPTQPLASHRVGQNRVRSLDVRAHEKRNTSFHQFRNFGTKNGSKASTRLERSVLNDSRRAPMTSIIASILIDRTTYPPAASALILAIMFTSIPSRNTLRPRLTV